MFCLNLQVLAILRAYTAALGGNALTSFYITQLMLQDNAHKNQVSFEESLLNCITKKQCSSVMKHIIINAA